MINNPPVFTCREVPPPSTLYLQLFWPLFLVSKPTQMFLVFKNFYNPTSSSVKRIHSLSYWGHLRDYSHSPLFSFTFHLSTLQCGTCHHQSIGFNKTTNGFHLVKIKGNLFYTFLIQHDGSSYYCWLHILLTNSFLLHIHAISFFCLPSLNSFLFFSFLESIYTFHLYPSWIFPIAFDNSPGLWPRSFTIVILHKNSQQMGNVQTPPIP